MFTIVTNYDSYLFTVTYHNIQGSYEYARLYLLNNSFTYN